MKNSIFLLVIFVDSYPHLLTDDCWDIANGKIFKEFQNWGLLYKVEFDLTITNAGSGWTNVFHFTANVDQGHYGDRIPALWIHSAGYFHISSSFNGGNYYQNFDFELGKMYHIIIQQYKGWFGLAYWFEIIIDGESKFQIENTQPQSFSSVTLYTSDPWYTSFRHFGSICNVKIHHDDPFNRE